jgi:lysine/ornithine N-monooxygenase
MAKGTFGFANYLVLIEHFISLEKWVQRREMYHVYLNWACRFLSSCMVIHVLARVCLVGRPLCC